MTAAYYRRKAADFERRASEAANAAERLHFEDEAARWRRMAEDADRSAPAEPPPVKP